MRRPPGLGRRDGFRGIGGVLPFTPASLTGLSLWLKASEGITLNGDDVSDWADQSTNGNDAAQGTALNQPVYTSSNAAFGGAPTVDFHSASTEYMVITHATTLVIDPDVGFSIYVVCNTPAGAANNRPVITKQAVPFEWRLRNQSGAAGPLFAARNGADTANFSAQWGSSIVGSGALVLSAFFNPTGDDQCEIAVDGGAPVVDSVETGHTSATTNVGLGAEADGSNPADVEIAEIVVAQSYLQGSTEEYNLLAYFTREYGV